MRGSRRNTREGLGFGLLLIGLGVVFLLGHFGYIEIHDFWRWWPLWTIGWGLVTVIGWQSAKQVGSGVTMMLIGVWLLISSMEWFGLGWHNSWPLVFVAIGGGMVAGAALQPAFESREAEIPREGGTTNG